MCLRHVEWKECAKHRKRDIPCVNPYFINVLLTEDEARAFANRPVSFDVDVLCSKKECFYQVEGQWQSRAQKRTLGQTCGFSGCLIRSCRLVVAGQSHQCPACQPSPENKRLRYILDVWSV